MPDFFGDGPPIPAGAGFMIDVICLAVLCLASIMTAWTDLRGGIIPDWLNLTILLLGLLWSFARDGWVAAFEAACAAAGVLRTAGQSRTRQTSLPFGPFLAIGLWAGLMLRQSGYLAV